MITQPDLHMGVSGIERRTRVALVTGASSGIGFATASVLANDVAVVVIHYRSNASGAEMAARAVAAAGAEPVLHQADLTRLDEVQRMADKVLRHCRRVDILVNNAGGVERIPILQLTPAQWHTTFAQNLDAAFYCTRALLPGMIDRGWGRIVNISTMASLRGGDQETVHYAAAKAALNVYSQSLARAVARTGVTVNVVAPGFVDTPLQDHPSGRRPIFEKRVARIPSGRAAIPKEIAAVVRFVASEAASYLIGEVITVSGGL